MIALKQEVTQAERIRMKRIREQEGLVGISEETKAEAAEAVKERAEAAEAAKERAERQREANDGKMERFPITSEVLSEVAELIVSLPSFPFRVPSSSLILVHRNRQSYRSHCPFLTSGSPARANSSFDSTPSLNKTDSDSTTCMALDTSLREWLAQPGCVALCITRKVPQ
jgi:hypothetical protein